MCEIEECASTASRAKNVDRDILHPRVSSNITLVRDTPITESMSVLQPLCVNLHKSYTSGSVWFRGLTIDVASNIKTHKHGVQLMFPQQIVRRC